MHQWESDNKLDYNKTIYLYKMFFIQRYKGLIKSKTSSRYENISEFNHLIYSL